MNAGPARPAFAWVATLDSHDRAAFYNDLAAAVTAARDADDIDVITECLRQWRLTAEGMTNAELRDSLLEP